MEEFEVGAIPAHDLNPNRQAVRRKPRRHRNRRAGRGRDLIRRFHPGNVVLHFNAGDFLWPDELRVEGRRLIHCAQFGEDGIELRIEPGDLPQMRSHDLAHGNRAVAEQPREIPALVKQRSSGAAPLVGGAATAGSVAAPSSPRASAEPPPFGRFFEWYS